MAKKHYMLRFSKNVIHAFFSKETQEGLKFKKFLHFSPRSSYKGFLTFSEINFLPTQFRSGNWVSSFTYIFWTFRNLN